MIAGDAMARSAPVVDASDENRTMCWGAAISVFIGPMTCKD